ncbi:uncharacterized protein [Chiloscyllium punctatum]|uniref:uncharacterized protein isoform X1 n=1 Tax=Chiloscyllium punctatum TaxID=137246 RepID=UPI003B642A4C
MHLQPALVLVLCAFLGYGEMLKCYKCSGSKCNSTQMGVEDCGVGQVCMTMSTWQFQDGVLLKHSCVPSKDCVNISLNLGTIRKVISCCNHDLCNTNPVSQESSQMCVGCLEMQNDFKCTKKGRIRCQGTQTKCGRLQHYLADTGRNLTIDFQGCLSDSICHLNSTQMIFGMELQKSFECCDDRLCNGSARTEMGAHCTLLLSLYLLLSSLN